MSVLESLWNTVETVVDTSVPHDFKLGKLIGNWNWLPYGCTEQSDETTYKIDHLCVGTTEYLNCPKSYRVVIGKLSVIFSFTC
jgi:hypothetical protein